MRLVGDARAHSKSRNGQDQATKMKLGMPLTRQLLTAGTYVGNGGESVLGIMQCLSDCHHCWQCPFPFSDTVNRESWSHLIYTSLAPVLCSDLAMAVLWKSTEGSHVSPFRRRTMACGTPKCSTSVSSLF